MVIEKGKAFELDFKLYTGGKHMDMLDHLCICVMLWGMKTRDNVKDFLKSQDGVSNVVATIIILLIVVLLIGVFWERLQEWLSGIMEIIFGTSFDAGGLG